MLAAATLQLYRRHWYMSLLECTERLILLPAGNWLDPRQAADGKTLKDEILMVPFVARFGTIKAGSQLCLNLHIDTK